MSAKSQRRLIIGSLVVATLLCGFIAYLAVTNNPERPVSELLCPINYDLADEPCHTGRQKYDSKRFEVLPAVQLGPNQAAVYQPAGGQPPELVQGIGYHEVPQRYSLIYPTNLRTIKTERDLTNPAKCTPEQQGWGECNTPLDNVRLQGAVEAVIDYEVDLLVEINPDTVDGLVEIGGYPALVDRLTSFVRSEFRDATAIDPALYQTGNISQALEEYYLPLIEAWEYGYLVDITALRIRSVTIEGDVSASALTYIQQEQAAEAYATQMAVICRDVESEFACAQHMAVFHWEQAGAQGQPPLLVTPPPGE